MKIFLPILALTAFAAPALTRACSLVPPPISATAKKIAGHGLLIRGRLIQAFDPDKERPEVIEIDEMYVGDVRPRTVVIYRAKADFEQERKLREAEKKGIPRISCASPRYETKLGKTFDRLVLAPPYAKEDAAANGRWGFEFWDGQISRNAGLDLLLYEAAQVARLKVRPVKDAFENCRECKPVD